LQLSAEYRDVISKSIPRPCQLFKKSSCATAPFSGTAIPGMQSVSRGKPGLSNWCWPRCGHR
jgi:hypothetical protein